MTPVKHQPATALPWKVAAVAPGRYPFYPIVSGEHNVAQVDINARGGSNRDAAYIAHACNVYPKLVEALHVELARAETEYAIHEIDQHSAYDGDLLALFALRALLRDLGESE